MKNLIRTWANDLLNAGNIIIQALQWTIVGSITGIVITCLPHIGNITILGLGFIQLGAILGFLRAIITTQLKDYILRIK